MYLSKVLILSLVALFVARTAWGDESEIATETASVYVVRGEGSVKVVPDVIRLFVTIEFEALSGEDPWGHFKSIVEDVYKLASEHGVKRSDFEVFWIEAESRLNRNKLDGKSFNMFGALTIDTSVSGRNGLLADSIPRMTDAKVESVEYLSRDEQGLRKLARTRAIISALGQANTVANAAGMKVGDVLRIGPEPLVPEPMLKRQGFSTNVNDMMGRSVPLEPGEIEFKEVVELKLELLPADS